MSNEESLPPAPLTLSPVVAAPSRLHSLLTGAGLNILLAVVSGICASLLFPPHEIWWLAWPALVPLLIALRRTVTVRAAGWLTLLFGIIFAALSLSWLTMIFGTAAIGISLLVALPWVLFGLAYRSAGARLPGFAVVLLAPVFFLAAEWIRCEGWYFQFSWLQLGNVFVPCRHGTTLYPYIGVYGVTFLIVLVNALIVEVLLSRRSFRQQAAWLLPLAVGVVGLSCYFISPTTPSPATGQPLRAGIVQDESGDVQSLLQLTKTLAPQHPALVVWPEYAVLDYPLAKPKLLAQLQASARALHCTLVLGCKDHAPADSHVDWLRRRAMLSMEGSLYWNLALVIGSDGQMLGRYAKTHPIQFFSDGVPGRRFPAIPTPVGPLGIAICYDFDFASTAVRLVHSGAELLLAPTYDETDWGEIQHLQHARIAQARAAETARWVVRATSSGVSQFIDPVGQVTSSLPYRDVSAFTDQVALRKEITPYVAWGYRLPLVCLGISLLWLLWMVFLQGRPTRLSK